MARCGSPNCSRRARTRSSSTASCSLGPQATRGQGRHRSRRPGCRYRRRRARPAPRSSTRSTARRFTWRSGSTWPWSRKPTPSGSEASRRTEAGAICGCCPRETAPTTATTTPRRRRRPDPDPQRVRPRRQRDPPLVGHRAHVRAARRGRGAPACRLDLADLERARPDAGRTGFGRELSGLDYG